MKELEFRTWGLIHDACLPRKCRGAGEIKMCSPRLRVKSTTSSCPRGLALIARDRGLCCRQPRDRHPVWRARNIIHPRAIAELDGTGLAAVLAADPDLEIRACRASVLHGPFDQHADA